MKKGRKGNRSCMTFPRIKSWFWYVMMMMTTRTLIPESRKQIKSVEVRQKHKIDSVRIWLLPMSVLINYWKLIWNCTRDEDSTLSLINGSGYIRTVWRWSTNDTIVDQSTFVYWFSFNTGQERRCSLQLCNVCVCGWGWWVRAFNLTCWVWSSDH